MNLIDQGLVLLTYGMGTVFAFLTLLVGATIIMSRLVTALSKEVKVLDSAQAVPATDQVNPHTLKIISAAIEKYRNRPS